MTDKDALKPCPFCGGERARTIHIRDGRKVACICGACGKPEFHGPADRPSAESRAIAAWNTRTPAEATALADELEELLAKRADRSVPGARVHDRLTHFVEANKVAILSALRSRTVNDELVEALREMVESCGITPSIHDGCGTTIITAPSAATFVRAAAALAKLGGDCDK